MSHDCRGLSKQWYITPLGSLPIIPLSHQEPSILHCLLDSRVPASLTTKVVRHDEPLLAPRLAFCLHYDEGFATRRSREYYSRTEGYLTHVDFGLPILAEKATHIPGVYTEQPTKLMALAKAIEQTLNDTGNILLKLGIAHQYEIDFADQVGYADFAGFVIDTLSAASTNHCDRLVERLSTSWVVSRALIFVFV